jgi:hypothetical protein
MELLLQILDQSPEDLKQDTILWKLLERHNLDRQEVTVVMEQLVEVEEMLVVVEEDQDILMDL